MISAISFNNKINSFRNPYMKKAENTTRFCGMYSNSGKNQVKSKNIAQIDSERSYMVSKFLTEDSMKKYRMEQDFVREIQDEIQNRVNQGKKKPFSEIMGYMGNIVTVDADYTEQDGIVRINKIVRNNRNSSKDIIELNEKGDITKITSGIFNFTNGNTIIKEEMIYKDGLIKSLRIDTDIKKLKTFIMTEILYSNGKIKEVRENVTKTFWGQTFIGKREVYN